MMDKRLDIAKNVILEEVGKAGFKVDKIILFGSRARGDYDDDSDFDFYVVVDKSITDIVRDSIIVNIKRRLARLHIPNDVFIASKDWFDIHKRDVGQTCYYALREGIAI